MTYALVAACCSVPAIALPDAGVEEASQEESRLLPSVVRDAIEHSAAVVPVAKPKAVPVKASETLSKPAKAASEEHRETAKTSSSKSGHKFAGLADYYHHSLYGRRTASGQTLQKHLLTAAHRTLPFGTRVKVHNPRSGRSCIVVINDRGPFTKSKVIDLSHEAARQIGLLQAGTAPVVCTVVHSDSNSDPNSDSED